MSSSGKICVLSIDRTDSYSIDYLKGNGTQAVYEHDGGVIAAILIATISFLFTCVINALASTGPNSK